MISNEALRALRNLDWDFVTPRSGYVAPLHWYPGTFVPSLSDALIEALCPTGGLVFDPYGGIGTSGLSAIRLGRSCYITDLNPVAVLAAYFSAALLAAARTHPELPSRAVNCLAAIVGRSNDLLAEELGAATSSYAFDEIVATIADPNPTQVLKDLCGRPPAWDELAPWFEASTLIELRDLYDRIRDIPSAYVQLMGICMLSAVSRGLSSQHASWGHIADNVRPKTYTAQSIQAAAARWLRNTVRFSPRPQLQQALRAVSIHVQQVNWSQPRTAPTCNADLLLTSPPYADAIDYLLSQRLSLHLFGYSTQEISKLVSSEIGARRKRFASTSRTDWSEQLHVALEHQLKYLKPSGVICLVLPHKDSGRSNGEDRLRMALQSLNWNVIFEKDRSIHQSHTRQSWTSIKRETIIAFSRGNA